MAIKEDLRVQRTKKALAEAFSTLLEQKPFDEITINELCEMAGVRRATFYKHYNDKYDFLSAYAHSLRDMFDRQIWPITSANETKAYFVNYAKRAIEYISENENTVNHLLKSNVFASALSIIVYQNYQDTLERLREGVANGLKLPCAIDTAASMLAGGLFAAIFSWHFEGKKIPSEQLAEEVGNFVASVFRD
jgi:AcrR family transcriptional regulator